MDPVTQGVLGATLPKSIKKRQSFLWVGLCGLVGGMAPDLDSFIRSSEDPLLYLEYHRQFTHSLIFIPFGGLLCALILHFLIGHRKAIPFSLTLISCTLGYATHGLLDANTSYGTMLFWPFSDARLAWSYISIIDPLFTTPILILAALTIWRKSVIYARLALVWGLIYLGFGAYQNQAAVTMGEELAKKRGHTPVDLSAKPSFGNLLVWKIIYRHKETYFVDAVRVTFRARFFQGTSIQALKVKKDFPWLEPQSQQRKDIERFRWFSKGYIAKDPKNPNRIIDLRYSLLPNEIDGLWSIELSRTATLTKHARFLTHRNATKERRERLVDMIFGD